MAKELVVRGATSQRIVVFIQDSSKTTGAGLTGLTSASSGLIWYWYRSADTAPTTVSIVGQTLGTWTSGGFVEISSTHMPGFYELGVPNGVFSATGSPVWAVMQLSGVTNMVPVNVELQLTAIDVTNGVNLNLSAIPNASPGNGGLIIGGTTSYQLFTDTSGRVNVGQWLGTAVTAATGGIPDVNTKNYNNQTAQTDANNLPKVDLVDIAGVAISTTSAQLGVNVVQYNAHTAVTDLNNLPKVDVEDFGGTAGTFTAGVPNVTANLSGTATANVVAWNGTAVTAATGGIPDVNVKNWNNHLAKSDANNYPEVDVEDVVGSTATNLNVTYPTNFSSLSIDGSGRVTIVPSQITVKKNVLLNGFTFPMFSATAPNSLASGLSVTSQRSIDGGTIASTANAVTAVGSGIYSINLAASDLNGNTITFIFTATGALDSAVTIETQP